MSTKKKKELWWTNHQWYKPKSDYEQTLSLSRCTALMTLGLCKGIVSGPWKNSGHFHQWCVPIMHCNWGNPILCLDQPITKGDAIQLGGHASYHHWQPHCHQTRTVQQSRPDWSAWLPHSPQYLFRSHSSNVGNGVIFCSNICKVILNCLLRQRQGC